MHNLQHMISLCDATDLEIVLAVLRVLFVFARRSTLLQKLNPPAYKKLMLRLKCLAEVGGGGVDCVGNSLE